MSASSTSRPANPEPAGDPGTTLDAALREQLEATLAGWSDSTLVACLAAAEPIERGCIIRELEARAPQRRWL